MGKSDFNMSNIRGDFPILKRCIGSQPLIYLDNAATTQLPCQVLDTIRQVYTNFNANVHRASHTLCLEATNLYEQAHENVARFIGAADGREIIFVRNTTEAINLVAHSVLSGLGDDLHLRHGDEVVTTIMEHHSNLVPWQMVRDKAGVTLKIVDIDNDGHLDLEKLKAAITNRTRIVCCSHVSNVLGTINPVEEIGRLAHEVGALFLVDGAQSIPHMPVDVRQINCDFIAFSGHKMLAPMGIGVLYGKRSVLEKMPPFLYGGDMIKNVSLERATWNDLPWKFEAGTANVCGGIALGGALERKTRQQLDGAVSYLNRLGMDQVRAHEIALTTHAMEGLKTINNARIYGPLDPEQRGGILAFNVGDHDAHLVAQFLNDTGITVRSGNHCAYPLADRLGVGGTVRASFYIYNTHEEVDCFIRTLKDIVKNRLI